MIQRVRGRLLGLALLLALVAGIASAAVMHTQAAADVLPIAIGAFVIAMIAGSAVALLLRGTLRDLVRTTQDVVRHPSRRIASDNGGVAQVIKSTKNAIGYVDLPDAKAAGLTYASVKNQAGKFWSTCSPWSRRSCSACGACSCCRSISGSAGRSSPRA